MKAATFDYVRPSDLAGAIAALAEDGAKPLSGGQSLGPMLNLRLARPRLLVDVGRLPELRACDEGTDGVLFGAALTHAEFEDGTLPDPTGGVLAAVARGIAYRAVRNRGTIGGSLAHADPAADWPAALAALGATVRLAGPEGERTMGVADFVLGPFETALRPREIVAGVFVPRLSQRRHWGFEKSCRKVGEFADSMAAVLSDPDRGQHRVALAALEARPVVLADAADVFAGSGGVDRALEAAGIGAGHPDHALHRAVLARALPALDRGRAAA